MNSTKSLKKTERLQSVDEYKHGIKASSPAASTSTTTTTSTPRQIDAVSNKNLSICMRYVEYLNDRDSEGIRKLIDPKSDVLFDQTAAMTAAGYIDELRDIFDA